MYKSKLKMNDLNVRPETIKLLVGNVGSKHFDIALSSIFSGIFPWTRETKEKINKQDYTKLKKILHSEWNHQ